MIRYFYSAGFAGFNSTPDCLIKVLPSFIAEKRHEVTRIPEFNMCLLVAMYYKAKLFFALTNSFFPLFDLRYIRRKHFVQQISHFYRNGHTFSCFRQREISMRRMAAIVFWPNSSSKVFQSFRGYGSHTSFWISLSLYCWERISSRHYQESVL